MFLAIMIFLVLSTIWVLFCYSGSEMVDEGNHFFALAGVLFFGFWTVVGYIVLHFIAKVW